MPHLDFDPARLVLDREAIELERQRVANELRLGLLADAFSRERFDREIRENLLGQAIGLLSSLAGLSRTARGELQETKGGPFQHLFEIRGQRFSGETPTSRFRTRLAGVSNLSLPNLKDLASLGTGDLEARVQELQEQALALPDLTESEGFAAEDRTLLSRLPFFEQIRQGINYDQRLRGTSTGRVSLKDQPFRFQMFDPGTSAGVFRNLLPEEKTASTQLFELAGISAEDVRARMARFTPQGTTLRGTSFA